MSIPELSTAFPCTEPAGAGMLLGLALSSAVADAVTLIGGITALTAVSFYYAQLWVLRATNDGPRRERALELARVRGFFAGLTFGCLVYVVDLVI